MFHHNRHSRDNWFGSRLWAERDQLDDQTQATRARSHEQTEAMTVLSRDPIKFAPGSPKCGRMHFREQHDGAFRVAAGERTAKTEMTWEDGQRRGRALTSTSSNLRAAKASSGDRAMVKHPFLGGGRKKPPPGAMVTRVGALLK